MKALALMTSAMALVVAPVAAMAQANDGAQPQSRQDERLGAILTTLFGDRLGSSSLEAQWAAGRMPLATQKTQFEGKVDTEVRSGSFDQATGTRLKTDYGSLVELESRYGADRRFTTQERSDLADRYGTLTQALADKKYPGAEKTGAVADASVANGKVEFDRRVDAGVASRKLSRVQGTRLKADYTALVGVESDYLRDGTLSARERDDLDTRLDALDGRVGDTGYGGASLAARTPRSRLDAITSALPRSGLSSTARSQMQVELGDLARLEAAYGRYTPSSDEQTYLERRLSELETRAKVRG